MEDGGRRERDAPDGKGKNLQIKGEMPKFGWRKIQNTIFAIRNPRKLLSFVQKIGSKLQKLRRERRNCAKMNGDVWRSCGDCGDRQSGGGGDGGLFLMDDELWEGRGSAKIARSGE